jgi:hypothetical protein
MRLIVVLAGAFGFMTVLAGSLIWEKPLDVSLVNGIVSALVAAILFRWWMKIWISSLEQVSREDEMSAQHFQMEMEPVKPKQSEFRKP